MNEQELTQALDEANVKLSLMKTLIASQQEIIELQKKVQELTKPYAIKQSDVQIPYYPSSPINPYYPSWPYATWYSTPHYSGGAGGTLSVNGKAATNILVNSSSAGFNDTSHVTEKF